MDSLGTMGGCYAGRKREVRGQARMTEYWDMCIFGHDDWSDWKRTLWPCQTKNGKELCFRARRLQYHSPCVQPYLCLGCLSTIHVERCWPHRETSAVETVTLERCAWKNDRCTDFSLRKVEASKRCLLSARDLQYHCWEGRTVFLKKQWETEVMKFRSRILGNGLLFKPAKTISPGREESFLV